MLKTRKKPVISKFADEGNYEPEPNRNLTTGTHMVKNNSPKGNKKIFAKFLVIKNNQQKIIFLQGQNARTLIALKEAKSRGITSLQIDELKLLRLSSYIHILRHEHGVEILTIREGEKRIARYVLKDVVELVKSSNSESAKVKNG